MFSMTFFIPNNCFDKKGKDNMTTYPSTSTPQQVTISLSREELYVVMHLIKATRLPGFDLAWLEIMPDGKLSDEARRMLEVATNALIARGYLAQVKEATDTRSIALGMPSPVVALVGACAFADYSILLAIRTHKGHQQAYVHELSGMGAIHTMPLPNIHQFEAVEDRAVMLTILENILSLHTQPEPSLLDGKVFTVNVQAARDAAIAGQADEAVGLLARGGLPIETAQALGKAMQESVVQGAITIASRDAKGQHHEATIAIVITPEICFMLTDIGSHPATFHVRPLSAKDLRQWIVSKLPPASQISSSSGQFKRI